MFLASKEYLHSIINQFSGLTQRPDARLDIHYKNYQELGRQVVKSESFVHVW